MGESDPRRVSGWVWTLAETPEAGWSTLGLSLSNPHSRGQMARLARVSSRCAKIAGSGLIPGQGTCKKQPMVREWNNKPMFLSPFLPSPLSKINQ